MLVGITGGIAAGKSRVAAYLAKQGGFPRLDVDDLARELMAQGKEGWQALRRHYGERFLKPDGELDRPGLRRAIFADPALRTEVDRLLHPLIRRAMQSRAAQLSAAGSGPIMVEVPLLYEAGWQDDFALVLVVQAPADECRRRLQARDRVGRDEALAALAAQLPPEEKARRADLLISNAGDWEQTRRRLDDLLPRLQRLRPSRPCLAGKKS
ncbi:dephospho-CoA kinase [Desulfurivibrio alkaliphilus]|uniref:Dephospho-CoA kinase n=1 Tax=Desulfurivibrio alkaliphilus (strain DSM 19089 / UNIQEM U267 / AHT2) TaxID=589865 RepID=D6Z156_DESAT|nr:dephospho-CoA kinase [Desulfurivibrio alkaliphilus]ADH85311.1 dephospho-CoA kinase [Desulfurivibrio alkaliphilus AHT 2]